MPPFDFAQDDTFLKLTSYASIGSAIQFADSSKRWCPLSKSGTFINRRRTMLKTHCHGKNSYILSVWFTCTEYKKCVPPLAD